MNKLLLASTALIASAGVAAANVTFDGYGRFGVQYSDGADTETTMHQRFRLNITASTETNNGTEVYGMLRFQTDDDADNTAAGFGPGAAGFGVTHGAFNLEMGQVSDVIDAEVVLNYFGYAVGLAEILETDASFTQHDANGISAHSSAQRVTATYAANGFVASATYSASGTVDGDYHGSYWQAGAGYDFNGVNVGAIVADNDVSGKSWLLGVDGAVGDFAYNALLGDHDRYDDLAWAVSGEYSLTSATAVTALVAGGGEDKYETAYGVGLSHNLGGGVQLLGGVANTNEGNTQADFGIRFDF